MNVCSVKAVSSCGLVTLLVLLCSLPHCRCIEFSGPGTDRALEEIFKGRCADYQTGRVNPHVDINELKLINCTAMWELFIGAFAYRDPCDVTMDRYEPLIQQAKLNIPMDMALYWDAFDVFDVVRSYVDEAKRATSLEFMLIGYVMNGLVFCGQRGDPGLKYDSCPAADECGFAVGSTDALWAAASTYYGANGRGNVRIIFNSNRPGGAFQVENSFFAQFELEKMNASLVHRADIYIVTFLGEETSETCASESVQSLRTTLTDKGIPNQCTDQPATVLHSMCASDPTAVECSLIGRASNSAISQHDSSSVILLSLVGQLAYIIYTYMKWPLEI